jgi:hypothetical protein
MIAHLESFLNIQSVGLNARAIEATGIAFVSVVGLKEIVEKVQPLHTVHLKWPFGEPGDCA